jgi:hypothetical protein
MPGRVAKPPAGGGPDRFTDAFRAGLTRCAAQARAAAADAARARSGCVRVAVHARLLLTVRAHLRDACGAQVSAYGACVKGALPAVERGACEKEFAALRTCFFDAVRPPQRCARTHTRTHGLLRGHAARRADEGAGVRRRAQVKDSRKGK